MQNARMDVAEAGIKISGRNNNSLRHADDTTVMAENEEELKSLLMKVKEESEKLVKTQHSRNEDHGIRSHHSQQTDGETMETVTDFIFLGSKSLQLVTANMKLKDTWDLEEKLWKI